MRIINILVISIVLFFTFSCNIWDGDKERFIEAYKDILIVRETIKDTVIAKNKIEDVYKMHGYTEKLFKEEIIFFTENKEEFVEIMDSVRERSKREILDIKLKQRERRKAKAELKKKEDE